MKRALVTLISILVGALIIALVFAGWNAVQVKDGKMTIVFTTIVKNFKSFASLAKMLMALVMSGLIHGANALVWLVYRRHATRKPKTSAAKPSPTKT